MVSELRSSKKKRAGRPSIEGRKEFEIPAEAVIRIPRGFA